MNSPSPATKHRYDITMSRRTRKQTTSEKTRSESSTTDSKNRDTNGIVVSLENLLQVKDGEEISDHKSLKQLIRGDSESNSNSSSNNNNKGRNSLGQHFNEEAEKNLQMVKKNQNESVQEGLKFKKLVRRYAKVLGHMMKAKRDPHLGESAKKPVFKLPK